MSGATFERLEERRFLSAGDLDPTFGTGGRVVTDFSAGNDLGRQVVVGPDGKIVVVGLTTGPSGTGAQNFGLARYNPDGTLDSSFGTGGKVITDFNNSIDFGLAVQILGDGKILAAGVGGASTTFVMARYNVDGSLDGTFGSGGKAITTFTSNPTVSMGLQGSKIILGGTTAGNFEVARFNANGSRDTTFGPAATAGRIITDLGGSDLLNSIVVQSDGRIVAGGASVVGARTNLAFVRYTSEGKTLDSTFNGSGILITDFGTPRNSAQSLALQSDGKIVAAGVSFTAGGVDENTALLRLNSNGSLDNSFDGDGKVVTDFGGGDSALSVVIQDDGKIIAGGSAGGGFAISRYNTNGSLDGSFGSGGKVTTAFAGGGSAWDLALQPDGKLVAAGQVGTSPNVNFGLARYIASVVNTAPVAVEGSFSLDEDQSVSGSVSASDAENDALTFSLESSPQSGTVVFNADGTFSYTPAANFNGQDSFTFSVSDGSLSDTATVSITVAAVNDAPTAADAAVSVSEDGEVAIALEGSDLESSADQLTFTILSLPAHGVLSYQGTAVEAGDTIIGSPAQLSYAVGAASDEASSDSFTFSVSDSGDGASPALTSDVATVAITIERAAAGSVELGADGVLRIGGTEGNDAISASADGGNVQIVINGQIVSEGAIALGDVMEIRVWGRAGDDVIDVSGLLVSSFVHGGAGDDVLTAGPGDDLMLGGGGADHLSGGSGNDFLIGGAGSDRIVGSSGHDLLTAGEISNAFTAEALRAIGAAWAADKTVSEDDESLADDQVVDENFDQLTGASGADWFIISNGDKITDLAKTLSRDGDVVTYVD